MRDLQDRREKDTSVMLEQGLECSGNGIVSLLISCIALGPIWDSSPQTVPRQYETKLLTQNSV